MSHQRHNTQRIQVIARGFAPRNDLLLYDLPLMRQPHLFLFDLLGFIYYYKGIQYY